MDKTIYEMCAGDCGESATLIIEMDFGDLPMCDDCKSMYTTSEGFLKTRSIN